MDTDSSFSEGKPRAYLFNHGESSSGAQSVLTVAPTVIAQGALQYARLTAVLRQAIGYACAAYVRFRISDQRITTVVNIDFPNQWLNSHGFVPDRIQNAALAEWVRSRQPCFVRSIQGRDVGGIELQTRPSPLVGAVLHCICERDGSHALAFLFGTNPETSLLDDTIRFVMPFLYAVASVELHDGDNQSTLLTHREREVLALMCRGKTNHDISRLLAVSINTIKNHVQRILLKLDAENRTHAVARAREVGLV